MLRNKIIIFLIILLTACSNLEIVELKEEEKNNLTVKIEEFKTSLQNNNLENLELFFEEGIRNKFLVNEIKKMNFADAKIFYSQPSFENNKGKNVIAFILYDNSIYLDVTYEVKNGQWKVIDVNQKEE